MRTIVSSRYLRSAVVLALAAVLCVGLANPAGADTGQALQRCRAGDTPSGTAALHLAPQSLGLFVGVPNSPLGGNIWPGDVVRIVASGRISYGGAFNWRGTWGPDGNGQAAPNDWWWPYPGGPDAALVGMWNHTGSDFRVGSNSGCLVVPASTIGTAPWGMHLTSNDDWRDDNGDAGYGITVRLWYGS